MTKRRSFQSDMPRLLATTLALALSACATVSAPPHKSDDASAAAPLPGTQIITGEDMKKSGRTNNDAALRALSPIIHIDR